LTALGCARWLTGLGLTATFAVGSASVRAASSGRRLLCCFLSDDLSFSNRLSTPCPLGDGRFPAFRLGSSFCRHGSLPDAHSIRKSSFDRLPNKKVSQLATRLSSTIDRQQGECPRPAALRDFEGGLCQLRVIHDRCGSEPRVGMYVRCCPKAEQLADGLGMSALVPRAAVSSRSKPPGRGFVSLHWASLCSLI